MVIEELINYIDNNNIKKILVTGPSHSGSEDIGRMLSSSYCYPYFDREFFFKKECLSILRSLFSNYDEIICHCPDILPNDIEVFTVITSRNIDDIQIDRNKQCYQSNLSAEDFYLTWSDFDFFLVSWEEYKHIRTPQIYGFYHVAFIGDWQFVASKQIEKMKSSGIIDKTKTLYVGCLGDYNNISIFENLLDGINYDLISDTQLDKYEMFTLQRLQDLSQVEDFYCWYIHTKGVSANSDEWIQKQSWRCYMEEFILNQHDKCIDMLSYYDCVGVNKKKLPKNHFEGNFWWSKSGVIKTLGNLWEDRNYRSMRMNAEFWFGTNPNIQMHSLYKANLYSENINKFNDF